MTSWDEFLQKEAKEEYFITLMQKVDDARKKENVYPPKKDIFSCFRLCPYENVKAVIIGQDPYHGAGQAHGLSFSVRPNIKVPPSLKNIYKELKSDLNIDAPNHGYLVSWAKEGVLMLNTSFSVSEAKPASHKNFGWEKFTSRVLEVLNNYDKPLVFLLWGNHAINVGSAITNPKHLLLKSPHPSPLAGGGFFGTKPFSKTNDFLKSVGRGVIDWRLPDINSDNPFLEDVVKEKIIKKSYKKIVAVVDFNGLESIVLQNENTLEFLNVYTQKTIFEPLLLADSKVKVENLELYKSNGQWSILYTIYNQDINSKCKYQVVTLNLQTKEIVVLQKTKSFIKKMKTFSIKDKKFLVVAYDTSPMLVLKYDLDLKKEVKRAEFQKCESVDFHTFESSDKRGLLIELIDLEKSQYRLFDFDSFKELI